MFVGTIGIEARASLALGKSVSSSVRLIVDRGLGQRQGMATDKGRCKLGQNHPEH